jgi:hypothetical protein
MMRHPTARPVAAAWHVLGVLAFVGCTVTDPNLASPDIQAAKAGAGPSVTAATPPYGNRGESGKQVTITGSGFAAGDQASWERNGAADPKIHVVATQFVSATQLVATINIAGDAELAFYDVAVLRPGRKGGIGTMLFEVTQAVPVAGTSILRGVNENGLLGFGLGQPAYWSEAGGLVTLPQILPDGGGVWAIDEAGVTMTGFECCDIGIIPVWTLIGGTWQEDALPLGAGTVGGRGGAIASDPGSGEAVYIGGIEQSRLGTKKPIVTVTLPILWRRGVAGWERIGLPSLAADGSGTVIDVNPSGVAVGNSNGQAVIWEPSGSGGWSIASLPGNEVDARSINSAGDLIGGGVAAYWLRQAGGGWTINHLPMACGPVKSVDDLGRIAAARCPQTSRMLRPAIFSPPYTDPPVFLGSLGVRRNETNVGVNLEFMSSRGSWVVGQIDGTGVYWRVF